MKKYTALPVAAKGTPAEKPAALVNLAKRMLGLLQKAGADEAEVMVQHSIGLTLKVREGKLEEVKQGEDKGLGVRFFSHKHLCEGASTDLSPRALAELAQRTGELVKHVQRDPHHRLSPPAVAKSPHKLSLYQDDFSTVAQAAKVRRLQAMEKAALAQTGISHSDGASYHEARTTTVLVNSLGQKIVRQGTSTSVWIGVYAADKKDNKQVAWEGTAARSLAGLGDFTPWAIRAAEEAHSLLGAKPLATGQMPVVFSNQQSGVIFSGLLGAMKGSRLANKNSYMLGRVGKLVAGKNITLVEDPHLPGGLGSGLYDGEGTPKQRRVLVDEGRFTGFVFDNYYASKCKTQSTGNASRGGVGGGIGIGFSNVLLMGHEGVTSQDVIAQTQDGFYVLGTMGFGVNPVTGDFSLGAWGRRIRKGELAEPVAQVTVAGKLQEILAGIDLIAGDPRTDSTLMVPTLRVKQMMVAGR